jgi:hypothetical protein
VVTHLREAAAAAAAAATAAELGVQAVTNLLVAGDMLLFAVMASATGADICAHVTAVLLAITAGPCLQTALPSMRSKAPTVLVITPWCNSYVVIYLVTFQVWAALQRGIVGMGLPSGSGKNWQHTWPAHMQQNNKLLVLQNVLQTVSEISTCYGVDDKEVNGGAAQPKLQHLLHRLAGCVLQHVGGA